MESRSKKELEIHLLNQLRPVRKCKEPGCIFEPLKDKDVCHHHSNLKWYDGIRERGTLK